MHKSNSTLAGASRDIGVNMATTRIARRSDRAVPLMRSILRGARRWLAGRRADIQVVAIQRGNFSMIT
jgi:hypothetical protein